MVYEQPSMLIMQLETEDVIRTSGLKQSYYGEWSGGWTTTTE